MSRILIVEDERHLAEGLRFNLEAEGHEVTVAASGEEGLGAIAAAPRGFDLLVLDVMLPGKDGFAVAAELRRQRQFLPILMLTARGSAEDVLAGFAAGADDYLPKPFELAILRARIHGLLRRQEWQGAGGGAGAAEQVFDGRHVDIANLEIRHGERRYPLTRMEAHLLQYLIERPGRAVSRKELLEGVWGLHEETDTRAIDNFIVRLRRYLEDEPSRPRHLTTVRGVGYRFEATPEAGRRD